MHWKGNHAQAGWIRGFGSALAFGAASSLCACTGESSHVNLAQNFHSRFPASAVLGELSPSGQEAVCHERFDHLVSLLDAERFCLLSAKVSSFYALNGTTADGKVPDAVYQAMCASKYEECNPNRDALLAKYQVFSTERCNGATLQIGCQATVAQMESCVRAEASADEALLATPCERASFSEHAGDSPAKQSEQLECKEFKEPCVE
jgi:hypothetical protein